LNKPVEDTPQQILTNTIPKTCLRVSCIFKELEQQHRDSMGQNTLKLTKNN